MTEPLVVQTAFPTTGDLIPSRCLFDSPRDFRDFANSSPRTWIRHLGFELGSGPTHQTLGLQRVTQHDLIDFSSRLNRARLVGECPWLIVRDLECPRSQDDPSCEGGCTSFAIKPDPVWTGNSHQLAVAVGMVAAARKFTIPPWVLFSADLEPDSVKTQGTDELAQKVRIALGHGPGYEHLADITECMYAAMGPRPCLGLSRHRVVAGKATLLIVSSSARVEDLADEGFQVERIVLDLDLCGNLKPRGLRDHFAKLADGGIVVAPVPSVVEALPLIGCDLPDDVTFAPVLPAYRVRPQASRNPAAVRAERLRYLQDLYQEFCMTRKTKEEDALEFLLRLSRCELTRSLHLGGQRASCFAGHVALLFRRKGQRVMLIQARTGEAAKPLTLRYPGEVGVTRRVLDSKQTQAVKDFHGDPAYRSVVTQASESLELYFPGGHDLHMSFLRRVGALVKIPIQYEGEVVGVLSLHCDGVVTQFDDGVVELLEKLAAELIVPLRELALRLDARGERGEDATHPYLKGVTRLLDNTLGQQPELLDAKLRDLGDELARRALRRVKAYRTAVRLFDPGRRHLRTIAWKGESEAVFPPWFRDKQHRHGLEEDSAAKQALDTGDNYFIDEMLFETPHYKPVSPLGLGSPHASVLLRHRGHPLGVLSVDWSERRHIPFEERESLRQLAHQCAIEMKSAIVTAKLAGLRQCLGEPLKYLRTVGEMVGAAWMALYLRDSKTGLYVLEGSLGHSTDARQEKQTGYRRKQGWVGWVVAKNQTLRVANRLNRDELERFSPVPEWAGGHSFDKDFGDKPVAWMGVPIASQGDVLGVMRFASENKSGTEGFSDYDQGIAEAAVARLADHLAQKMTEDRQRSLLECGRCLATLTSSRRIAEAVCAAIKQEVGESTVGMRRLDEMWDAHLGRREGFHRLYMSDLDLKPLLPKVRPRLSGGISDHILTTGRPLVCVENAVQEFMKHGIDAQTKLFIRAHGSHSCNLLKTSDGRVLGTMHVARAEDFSLSNSDVAFIVALIELAGAAMGQAEVHRRRLFELALRTGLMRRGGAVTVGLDPPLAVATLGGLLELIDLPDGRGMVWLSDEPGEVFVGRDHAGRQPAWAVLKAGDVRGALEDGPALVSEPESDARFLTLLAGDASEAEELSRCQRAALPVFIGGELRAVFVLVAPEHETVGFRALDAAHESLSSILAASAG